MTATATDWEALQESWNAQQEGYLAARHQRLDLLAQLVRASGGPNPLVVDLACGTGSVTRAVLQVVPGARVVAVDADPVLLTIAGHTVGQDDRVTLHTGDLRQPGWAADLVEGPVDAVVSATALHWLTEARTAALYAELAGLLRTGGLFADADHTPLDVPQLSAVSQALAQDHRDRAFGGNVMDWPAWWTSLEEVPELAEPLQRRRQVFGEHHRDGHSGGEAWRAATLSRAGFTETAVVWRHLDDAITAAIR